MNACLNFNWIEFFKFKIFYPKWTLAGKIYENNVKFEFITNPKLTFGDDFLKFGDSKDTSSNCKW